MKHGLPLFIGEGGFFKISTRRYASVSKLINDEIEYLLGI
jgi:hypothetical protein